MPNNPVSPLPAKDGVGARFERPAALREAGRLQSIADWFIADDLMDQLKRRAAEEAVRQRQQGDGPMWIFDM